MRIPCLHAGWNELMRPGQATVTMGGRDLVKGELDTAAPVKRFSRSTSFFFGRHYRSTTTRLRTDQAMEGRDLLVTGEVAARLQVSELSSPMAGGALSACGLPVCSACGAAKRQKV